MMTKNEQMALEALQMAYFDVCDLLNGNSYTQLGYDNKKEFLEILRDRLSETEDRLFPVIEEVA
jgi:hypothetical protein